MCHNSQLEEQDERDDESLVQQMLYFLICLIQTGSASRHVGNQQDGEMMMPTMHITILGFILMASAQWPCITSSVARVMPQPGHGMW